MRLKHALKVKRVKCCKWSIIVSKGFTQMIELLNIYLYMCLKDCNRTNLLFT